LKWQGKDFYWIGEGNSKNFSEKLEEVEVYLHGALAKLARIKVETR